MAEKISEEKKAYIQLRSRIFAHIGSLLWDLMGTVAGRSSIYVAIIHYVICLSQWVWVQDEGVFAVCWELCVT